jgi:hypothetical protein
MAGKAERAGGKIVEQLKVYETRTTYLNQGNISSIAKEQTY